MIIKKKYAPPGAMALILVECSWIGRSTADPSPESLRATRKPMLMVFRATRKLMLWYLEQSVNSSYRIYSNKEINAKGNKSNKEPCPSFRDHFLETWELRQIS